METNVKFDVVVGNPPFSAPSKSTGRGMTHTLFNQFYRKSVEMANTVAMIMPSTDKLKHQAHNDLVKKTANVIEFIDSNVFQGIGIDCWYVIFDGRDTTPGIDWIYDRPQGNDLTWWRGPLQLGKVKPYLTDSGDVKVLVRINRNGIEEQYLSDDEVRPSMLMPDSGYAVITPLQMSDKGWYVDVVKIDTKTTATANVFATYVDTEDQAHRLKEALISDEFIEYAKSFRGGMGAISLGKRKMLELDRFGS